MGSDVIELLKFPKIMPLACEFNFLPTDYAHPSWLELYLPYKISSDMGIRGRRRFSAFLLKSLNLEEPFWQFDQLKYRYALLPSSFLLRFIRLTGVSLIWKPISLIIQKDALKKVKLLLGDDHYEFVVSTAPILIPSKWCVEAVPENINEIDSIGWQIIKKFFLDAPESFFRRFLLKFPKDQETVWNGHVETVKSIDSSRVLRKIFNYEAGPEWLPLFTE